MTLTICALLVAVAAWRARPPCPGATVAPSPIVEQQHTATRPGYLAYRSALEPAPSPRSATPAPTEEPEEITRRSSARGSQRPTSSPTSTPMPIATYPVAAGDTLAGIAAKFGIDVDTLLAANGIRNAGEILPVGRSLTILPVPGIVYTVKKGDMLLAIAEAQKVSPEAIIEANALADPNILQVDQQLIIPGGRQAPPPAPLPQPGGFEHPIVAGETVQLIARRYGVEPAAIIGANGLADPDSIRVGQRLLIPGLPATPAKPTQAAAPQATEPPPPPPPAGNKGEEIVAIAARFAGYRYTWGGQAPSTGFDCSGFSWYVCQQAGVQIPVHDLAGQLHSGRMVKRSELLPGDLVFFQNTFQAGLSHVGIYVGGGRFIHAATEETGVRYDSLDAAYWDVRFYGASRPG